jgi:hypothetical protein
VPRQSRALGTLLADVISKLDRPIELKPSLTPSRRLVSLADEPRSPPLRRRASDGSLTRRGHSPNASTIEYLQRVWRRSRICSRDARRVAAEPARPRRLALRLVR